MKQSVGSRADDLLMRGLRAGHRLVKSSVVLRQPGLAYTVHHVPGTGFRHTQRVAALTFDDGPDTRFTSEILDVLQYYDAKATFFMTGERATAHPELVTQVARAGHTIGCHTWDHADLTQLDEEGLDAQIGRTNQLLSELTGADVRLVRPPEGRIDRASVGRLRQRGLTTVLWTVGSKDWQLPGPSVIADRVLGRLHRGAVVALHDSADHTAEAMPLILEGFRSGGYRSVALGPVHGPGRD